jgi:uncharacterized repeat protein (TIGR02543 family)
MCGADIVQDNMYDNHLNNVNVLSTANPIYVTGSLEGSKIGLSDPRLWDDNMTDAQARDDGSAELLTNGYKANNSDVHPSEYFTSDHDTWIVDRTFPTMTEKTVRTRYKYSPTRYPVTSNIPLGFSSSAAAYLFLKAESFDEGIASTVDDLYNELVTRYSKHYKLKSSTDSKSVYTTVDNLTVTVNKNSSDVKIETRSNDNSSIYVKLSASPVNQTSYAGDGEIVLKVTSGSQISNDSFSSTSSGTGTLYDNYSFLWSSTNYEYDEIGRVTAKLSGTTKDGSQTIKRKELSGDDSEVRLVRRKTPIKFHTNNPTVTDKTTRNNELFRVYKADKEYTTEDGTYDLKGGGVEEFYNIPKFAKDDYVFAGWYTVANNDDNDKSKAFEFNTAVPSDVEDVYAHWIRVGEVDKDDDDDKELPSSMNGKYKGFDLCGVQIRPKKNYDYNYEKEKEGGLRFVASISESLLSKINAVHTDNKIEYGFVSASENMVKAVVNKSDMNIDKASYTLQYKGKNVNGVDTTDKTLNPNNFRYITNVDCTSKVGGYGSNPNIKLDHRNFTNYRLASYVVTYNDDESGKGENVAARAYLRYTDANGLLRTFYNNYSGTNFYGGCSTNYTDVEKNMATNTKTVKN